jgi:hypothetical protein
VKKMKLKPLSGVGLNGVMPTRVVEGQVTQVKEIAVLPAVRRLPTKSKSKPGAALVTRPLCPLCKRGTATTEIQVGPIYTKVCVECSQPVFHAFGLLEWFKRFK